MPIITLPDGNNIDFPNKVTGLEVAEKISKSLAKQAMVISVDGELKTMKYYTMAYEKIHGAMASMRYMLKYYLNNYAK